MHVGLVSDGNGIEHSVPQRPQKHLTFGETHLKVVNVVFDRSGVQAALMIILELINLRLTCLGQ